MATQVQLAFQAMEDALIGRLSNSLQRDPTTGTLTPPGDIYVQGQVHMQEGGYMKSDGSHYTEPT